jgi:hypothetical protein
MVADLDMKKMSKSEKLRLLEALWIDLSVEEHDIVSPSWHEEALLEAERLHAEGKSKFSDWNDAKERVRAAVSAR